MVMIFSEMGAEAIQDLMTDWILMMKQITCVKKFRLPIVKLS